MDKGRKKLLKQVPTRKLVASIKKDARELIRTMEEKFGKPKKK